MEHPGHHHPVDHHDLSWTSSSTIGGDTSSQQPGTLSETTQDVYDEVGVVKCHCDPPHLVRLIEADPKNPPLSANLRDLWKKSELCDVTLVADGVEMPAHRLILASVSPYFRTLFGSGLTDAKSGTISMVNFSPGILKKLLKYVYEQEMCLNMGEELDLLVGMDYLQLVEGAGLTWLEGVCWSLAETHLCHTSAVRTLNVADKSRLATANKLVKSCLQLIVDHLVEVMEEKEHLFLSTEHLLDVLSRRQFRQNYSREVQARFVQDWLTADWPARSGTLPQLVVHVNEEDVVRGLADAGLAMKGCLECADRPQKKMKSMTESCHTTSDPIILMFESGSYDILYYDVVNNTWGVFAGPDSPGNHDVFDGRMVSADGGKVVFSAAAFDGGHMIKSIEMWPDRPKFASFNQNLHKGFVISAGCLSNDDLFLHNGVSEKLNICRRAVSTRLRRPGQIPGPAEVGLRPLLSIAMHIRNCSLIELRSDCCNPQEKRLLAVGGENAVVGVNKQRNVTMYKDDSACGGMVSVPVRDMSVGRARPGVAVISGLVYVFGGDGGVDKDQMYERPDLNQVHNLNTDVEDSKEHRHCEVYDPVTDIWRRLSDLAPGLVRISGCGVAQGNIILVGLDKAGTLLVRQYNPCRDRWSDLATRPGHPGQDRQQQQLPVIKMCVIDKPGWLVNKLTGGSLSEDELSECSGFHNKCFHGDSTTTKSFSNDISSVSCAGRLFAPVTLLD